MNLPAVTVRLKPGREKSVRRGHPWIFSGAIADTGRPESALAAADVLDHDGHWLARGIWHGPSALAVRLLTWDPDERIDESLFQRRLAAALARRRQAPAFADSTETNSWRLVFSEADGLSGLMIDQYADALLVQVAAKGVEAFLPTILDSLRELTGLRTVLTRADRDSIAREGLDEAAIAAQATPPTGPVRILQHGLSFEVDLAGGQKTGFYLDQRENRQRVAAWARNRRVLSAYCYTGAFEVYAARAGASEILGLDGSEPALQQARRHHELNGTSAPVVYENADVPKALRKLRDAARTFDMIILDPPRFVFTKEQKDGGLRAYKDINLLAMKLLTPGGVLATFSCSGLVTPADFRTTMAWAAADSGRNFRIVETLGQPFDHPILAAFPESEYLKGLIGVVE